jgi:hypothetical protein
MISTFSILTVYFRIQLKTSYFSFLKVNFPPLLVVLFCWQFVSVMLYVFQRRWVWLLLPFGTLLVIVEFPFTPHKL